MKEIFLCSLISQRKMRGIVSTCIFLQDENILRLGLMDNRESKISKKCNTDERGTERHTDTLAGVE